MQEVQAVVRGWGRASAQLAAQQAPHGLDTHTVWLAAPPPPSPHKKAISLQQSSRSVIKPACPAAGCLFTVLTLRCRVPARFLPLTGVRQCPNLIRQAATAHGQALAASRQTQVQRLFMEA